MKKLVVVVTLFTLSCASTGGIKKDATVALSATHAALDLIEITLLKTECGKSGAPSAPACVPGSVADGIYRKIATAAGIGEKASAAIRALPPSLDGSVTSPQIIDFISQIWGLISEIKNLFPSSDASKQLTNDLTKLEAKK